MYLDSVCEVTLATSARGQGSLKELETVSIILNFLVPESVEFRHLFANIVAHAQLAIIGHDFVVLLCFKLLAAKRVIT